MSELAEWRNILNRYFKAEGPDTLETLAKEMRVSTRTLRRWASGDSKPDSRLRLDDLEVHVPGIGPALRNAFPHLYESVDQGVVHIIAPFTHRVLDAYEVMTQSSALQTFTKLSIDTLMKLETKESSLIAFLAQLSTYRGEQQASHLILHSWSTRGTGIWISNQTPHSSILGKDSLCAMAVRRKSIALYPQDLTMLVDATNLFHSDEIKSAIAYPILRFGSVAGAVFVASTETDYFNLYNRELARHLPRMISLAFMDCDFFPNERISLHEEKSAAQLFLDQVARNYPGKSKEQIKTYALDLIKEEGDEEKKER